MNNMEEVNNDIKKILNSISYTSPEVQKAFNIYLSKMYEVYPNKSTDIVKADLLQKMHTLRFFPVYYDEKANVIYIFHSVDKNGLWQIKNLHAMMKIPRFYVKVSDTRLNNFIIHFVHNGSINPGIVSVQNQEDYKRPEIIKIRDSIISDAVRLHASDIHVEVKDTYSKIFFRINGILKKNLELDREKGVALVRSFASEAKLDIVDMVKPQNGSFQQLVNGVFYNIRLNVVGTFTGGYNDNPTAVLRILYQSKKNRHLDELGFAPVQLEAFKMMANREGIIILSGPTGSGKTTTLYALLDWFDTEGKKIISIEDPPEIIRDKVTQIAVQPARGITWKSALENMLRMDPDIILIGEIRDKLSAEAAMQAALTGHTVLTTIHAQSVETIIERFIQLAGEHSEVVNPHTLANHIIGLVAQRLFTKIGAPMASAYEVLVSTYPDLVKKMQYYGICIEGMDNSQTANCKYTLRNPVKLPNPYITNDTVYRGYDMTENGRTVVAEVVYNDADFSKLITKADPVSMRNYLNSMSAYNGSGHHLTLVDHAIEKVQQGLISITDVIKRI